MNIDLLKYLGNIDQIAGIREAKLIRGRGEGIQIAEFYNAAGLRFSVVPDRCSDIFDLSYKGVNLSFQTKNGLTSPQGFSPMDGEFGEQWPGGMLVTCGLDNVGGHCEIDGSYPTHGRISSTPAKNFGTQTQWEGDRYILRSVSETHQTKMYGRHLSVRRTVETELNAKKITIDDTVTNFEAEEEPYILLYHFNFGYPLLQETSRVAMSKGICNPLFGATGDPLTMSKPLDKTVDGNFLYTDLGDKACAVLYNQELELGAYVSFDTKNLPNLLEWKNMKSHDYVLALEPCTFFGMNRKDAIAQNKISKIPAYSSIDNHLELGVLDGATEIHQFIKNL